MMNPDPDEKDIMLADDDMDEVQIFDMALKELDFPHILRHAATADGMFLLLKEKIPYILFLDINMPCKDGLVCITEIRKHREYDALPVIMYSSHIAAKIVDEAFAKGEFIPY